ncbi:hypothetical protein NC652_021202 [Populus alba x Populus x berolinensis]|nr:hypothetical protein NC652_021202 [Populus alba x Populus x berolinensis]
MYSLNTPGFQTPILHSYLMGFKKDARLRISQTKAALPKLSHWLVVVSGLVDGNSETCPEAGSSDLNEEGAAIDIKLTRRSLLVQFTCNECGERSQRLINRLAYEQGLVFVQVRKGRVHNLEQFETNFYHFWNGNISEFSPAGAVSSDTVVTVGGAGGLGGFGAGAGA